MRRKFRRSAKPSSFSTPLIGRAVILTRCARRLCSTFDCSRYATSNGNGDFEITVTQTDSVLVFGEAKMPGEPFYYSAKVVGAMGQEEVRVMLLMCNQLL